MKHRLWHLYGAVDCMRFAIYWAIKDNWDFSRECLKDARFCIGYAFGVCHYPDEKYR